MANRREASLEKVGEELGLTFDTEECDTFGGYIFGLLGAGAG